MIPAMKDTKEAFLALVLLVASGTAFAQPDQDDNLNMDVIVDGIRENEINQANKLSFWPEFRENVVELPPITYNLIPNKLGVNIEPKLIKPAKVKIDESLKKLYRGYLRAGFGVYTTPLVEGYYMDGRSRNGTYSVGFRHLSSGGGNVAWADSVPDAFSNNELRLWGKRFMGKHALEAGFDWNRNVVHYYGVRTEQFPDVDLTDAVHQQKFNNIDGYLRLTSYFRDSTKTNYSGQVMFYNYRDAFNSNENNVDVHGHGRRFVGSELYSGDFYLNYNQYQFTDPLDPTEKLVTNDNVILGIVPQVSTIHERWRVNVGAGIFLDAKGEQPFHFYPRAEAKYNLISNLFIPYVGVTGNLERTTFKTITTQNPWVITNPELKSVNNKLELYGGVRGTISSNASFNARIARNRFEDWIYFANDSTQSNGNQFRPIYDDMTRLQIMGEVAINTNGALDLTLRGDYFIYGDIGQQLHPWDQPTTRVTLLTSYNIEDKLIATAEVYTVGKRKAKSFAEVPDAQLENDGTYTVDLKGYADLNLNVEYRYTKRVSAFVRLNNMVGGRYQQRVNYRVQTFNAMMGATYSF